MSSRWIVASSLVTSVLAVALGVWIAGSPTERLRSGGEAEQAEGPRGRKAKGKAKAGAGKASKGKAKARGSAQERRDERRALRQARRQEKADRRAMLAKKRNGMNREAVQATKPTPEEKALNRAEVRALQIDELLSTHDEVAEVLGLDPDIADEIAILMMDTSDRVGQQLERVDLGEVEWAAVRDDIRGMREAQVNDARDLLGDDVFEEWSHAMGFRRFTEEEWERQ